jgi:hypothetical protein
MIELIVIVLTVIVFVQAAKNRPRSYSWGLVGLLYYVLGRLLFSLFLFGGYRLFSNQHMDFRIYQGLKLIEFFGGISFGVLIAYVLGELSGLNIKKVFRNE